LNISPQTPKVIGHRGWPTRFPDNTLAGFLAASGVADGVELDVRRTSDGKLILSHDPEIGGLEVATNPWREIGEIDLGGGNRPALLDEVVASVPGLTIQFEIKNLPHQPGFEPDHRIALETAERARSGDMLTSFNWLSLAAVRREFDDVQTGVLVAQSGDVDQAIDECLHGGHIALLPSIELPTMGLVRALEVGLLVFPWVVDDAGRVDELVGLGVSGMITDDPGLVRDVVGRHR
jgi:glycerophosphoryl diester phosphodiesterase